MTKATNPGFYSIEPPTWYGFPWIGSLTEGFGTKYECNSGMHIIQYATGKLVGDLDNRGAKWPDRLGCGHFPFFIVSERVIDAWASEGIGSFPHTEIELTPYRPKKLRDVPPPRYYWIDGEKIRGALIDFEASGFVGNKFCPECGVRTDDVVATGNRQDEKAWPYVFQESSWNGGNLFTTDISSTVFFCTRAVVDCARQYKFTNMKFIPVEEGSGAYKRKLELIKRLTASRQRISERGIRSLDEQFVIWVRQYLLEVTDSGFAGVPRVKGDRITGIPATTVITTATNAGFPVVDKLIENAVTAGILTRPKPDSIWLVGSVAKD